MAPAMPTLMEKRVGIFTTCSQRASIAGDGELRSPPESRKWCNLDHTMTNPVLVEVTRGDLVESVHRGAMAIADAGGAIRWSIGDIGAPVYPRSSLKPVQALPLLESGAADAFGL